MIILKIALNIKQLLYFSYVFFLLHITQINISEKTNKNMTHLNQTKYVNPPDVSLNLQLCRNNCQLTIIILSKFYEIDI